MSEQRLHRSTGPHVRYAQTVPNVVPSSVPISKRKSYIVHHQRTPPWWELVLPPAPSRQLLGQDGLSYLVPAIGRDSATPYLRCLCQELADETSGA